MRTVQVGQWAEQLAGFFPFPAGPCRWLKQQTLQSVHKAECSKWPHFTALLRPVLWGNAPAVTCHSFVWFIVNNNAAFSLYSCCSDAVPQFFTRKLLIAIFRTACSCVKLISYVMMCWLIQQSHLEENKCWKMRYTSRVRKSRSWPKFVLSDLPVWVARNLNLNFKLAVPIRQNKCNNLLFYVLSFI